MSVSEIAKNVRTKQISAYEVVNTHIEHSLACNKTINAIACSRFEQAIREAKNLDALIHKKGSLAGTLIGVPFSVKESISLENAQNTSGSYLRKGNRSKKNATVVQRLMSHGAIPIAQTNLSELALWPECNNVIYGRTNNPYNTNYTSGGSSGGDASLVACRGVPFGIGTDGGGSIRIPSSHCGIFGHKPSSQYVPMTGHFPLDNYWGGYASAQFISRFFAIGPLCRHSEDLLLLLQIISGRDNIDKNISNNFRSHSLLQSLDHIDIYILNSKIHPLTRQPDENIQAAINQCVNALSSQVSNIHWISEPLLAQACELWFDIFSVIKDITLNDVANSNGSLSIELLRSLFSKKRIMGSTLLTLIAEKIPKKRKTIIEFLYVKNKITNGLGKYLNCNSLLLLPSFPSTSIKHGYSFLYPFDFLYCAAFNLLELPATTVPVFTSDKGLPVSIQLVGTHGCDHVPISIANFLAINLKKQKCSPF
jgi:fatty acid amide hydrolase 2